MLKFSNWHPPEGSMLFDVKYHYRTKNNPECFEVVYFNTLTKKLEVEYIEPIIDIWFLKPEKRTNRYQIAQARMDDCYPVYCKPSQICAVIAKEIGGEWEQWYHEARHDQMSNYDMKKHMCTCPWVFQADLLPDVYFRLKWMERYGEEQDVSKVSFGVYDIEADVIDRTLDLKDIESAPQPINAISIILPNDKIAALMVLGPRDKQQIDPKYHDLLEKQQKEYEWICNNQEEFIEIIKGKPSEIKLEHYTISIEKDLDNVKYIGDFDVRLHIFDFRNEIQMIKILFDYINKYRPMFMLAWNAQFDINYLMSRIKWLGYDPIHFLVPEQFETQQCYYSKDKAKDWTLKSSKDWMHVSSYTQYVCHLRLFVQIRKSQAERRSNSLGSIGKETAGIDKLTNTKSGTFREFAYTNLIRFLLYNVRDAVVKLAIELKCNDCQALMSRSYMFATQFSKCFQETHTVRNYRAWSYGYQQDPAYVQACRLEIDPEADSSYKGAFVADPENNAFTGYVLNGQPVKKILFGIGDADAAQYYPATLMGMNQDPMTLLGKCRIDNNNFISGHMFSFDHRAQQGCSNRSYHQDYIWWSKTKRSSQPEPHDEDMSGPICNSYKNENLMSLMYNWFNAPGIGEVFAYVDANL